MGIHYSYLDKRERTLLKTWPAQGLDSGELRRNLWCGKHYGITGAE